MTDGGKYKQTQRNKQTNTKTGTTITKIELNKDEIESADRTHPEKVEIIADYPHTHAFSAICCVFKVIILISGTNVGT